MKLRTTTTAFMTTTTCTITTSITKAVTTTMTTTTTTITTTIETPIIAALSVHLLSRFPRGRGFPGRLRLGRASSVILRISSVNFGISLFIFCRSWPMVALASRNFGKCTVRDPSGGPPGPQKRSFSLGFLMFSGISLYPLKTAADRPRWLQDGRRWPQDGPETAPRRPPDGSKTAPRRFQTPPHRIFSPS